MGIDQKITVGHLISGDLWAGAEVQTHALLSSLQQEPDLNLFAVVLNEKKLAAQLRQAGVETLVVDETRHGFAQIFKILKEKLSGRNIDILHSHRYKENILAGRLKKAGLTRFLVQTVHGTGEQFKGLSLLKMKLYTFLNLRQTRRHFDRIIAVSYDIARHLQSKLPLEKVLTIHNAVDLGRLQPLRNATETRKALKISDTAPLLGTAGRLVPVKGYDIFLEAARIILQDKPQATFLIAGDGPLREALQQKAAALGIDGSVRFMGFREDILDIVNSLDIFIMSSHHEGIPMILLETMALKKPVVCTAVGGIKEIIEDNLSGLLVKPGDVKALALACLIILNRPETAVKIGRGARLRVENEFSIIIQKKRVLELYRQLAGVK